MLAGCTAFHSHHRQYSQLRVNLATPPSQSASPHTYGLLDHLFQHQLHEHCPPDSQQYERSRNYEYFPAEMPFKHCEGDGAMDMGPGGYLQKRNSNNELDKLVNPFLGAEKRDGAPRKNQRCSSSERYREMDAVSLKKTSKFQAIMEEPVRSMREPTGARADETCQGRISGASCEDAFMELQEKKQWPLSSWNAGGAEQYPAQPSSRVEEELAPWLFADEASTGGALPSGAECLQEFLDEYHVEPPPQATPASSMSSAQNGLGEGTALGRGRGTGREATTASVRGSCSPSSVALSAESPSNSAPSSSTAMPSPPPSSISIMKQQDSPAPLGPSSSGGLLMTSSSNLSPLTNGRRARELCYGNMSPLSLAVPKSISFSGLHAGLFSANVGRPSLVQQQCLLKAEDGRQQCTELVDLLVACVEAISAGSLTFVNHLLAQLGKLASPDGSSMHRLAAYFTEGLACRVSKMWPHIYQPLLPSAVHPEGPQDAMRSCEGQDAISAWQVLNYATPLVKFSHFTANEMILQAFEGEERVHVIDLDIKQGLQWPALFQCLATRRGGPPQLVRVTGIGECKEEVQDAGDRLAEFAEEVGLRLEFHAVVDKLEDVRLWMLHVKTEPREAVAVNCIMQMHHTLHDDSGTAARNLLSLIHSTRPKVVALVEQEADCHDHPSLEARFSNALRYFAALFDALDASMPSSSAARLKVEAHFGAHIRNIVACDGSQRIERYQSVRRWQRLLTPAGFRCIPLSHRARLQAQILLRLFASPRAASYGLLPHSPAPDNYHLTVAWMNHPLFTASAWTPSSQTSTLTE